MTREVPPGAARPLLTLSRPEEYARRLERKVSEPERHESHPHAGMRFQGRARSTDIPAGFYVYQLIDPRTSLPFYIGKGQRGRAWDHQRDVERGCAGTNARKNAVIRKILATGVDVTVQIVAVYLLESQALDHEFRLIDATPGLTNMVAGGGGGNSLSEEEARRRTAARIIRIRRLKERERRALVRAQTERGAEHLTSYGRSAEERAEIERWLSAVDDEDAAALLAPRRKAWADRRQAEVAKLEARRCPGGAPPNRKRLKMLGARRGYGPAEINPADYIIR